MPTYLYVCTGCGMSAESPKLSDPDHPFRHLVGDEVCGVMRRDWKAEGTNFNRTNLRNR